MVAFENLRGMLRSEEARQVLRGWMELLKWEEVIGGSREVGSGCWLSCCRTYVEEVACWKREGRFHILLRGWNEERKVRGEKIGIRGDYTWTSSDLARASSQTSGCDRSGTNEDG